MRWLGRQLSPFWFQPMPAARLASLRILIGSYAFYYVGSRWNMYNAMAGGSPELFEPTGVVFLDGPLSPETFRLILTATLVLNVPFVLGWRFRWTGPLFAGFLLWVLCYRNSWTMIYHSHNLLVLHVFVLGFTPSAGALSLDSRAVSSAGARVGRLGTWPGIESQQDWRYGWPVRLICAVTALSYLLAGVAKVAGELGWSWASGAALRSQIVRDALRKELLVGRAPDLAYELYEHELLLGGLAVLSLALELGAPLVLLDRRVAKVWSVLAFAMHWGIYCIMGIKFRYQLSGVAFASFFATERLPLWLRDRKCTRG